MTAARPAAALAPAWFLVCAGLWLAGWLPGLRPAWIAWFWTPAPLEAAPLLAALGRHALASLAAAAVGLAAFAAGPPILRWTACRHAAGPPILRRVARHPGPQAPSLSLAVGLVLVLPAVALGLGLAGLLRPGALRAGTIAGAVAGMAALRRTRPFAGATATGLASAAVLLLPALVVALAPETSYDSLQYHLALPARYLIHGKVFDASLEPLSNFHLGGEMLLALGQAAGGDGAARLLTFAMLPLVLALLARAARAAGLAGPLAAAPWLGLVASPFAAEIAAHAYTDLPGIIACTAAALVVIEGGGRWFLVGLLFGAAGAAKLNATLLGAGMLAVLAPRGMRAIAGLGWIIPQAPWIIKNWALAGSPFGGLVLGSLLPALAQSEDVRPLATNMQWVPFGHPSLWLWLPRFLLRDAASAGGECSPLLAALLPALCLPRGALRAAPARLAPAALAGIALWAIAGGGQVRWLAPVLPLAALAAVLRLGSLPSPARTTPRWIALAFVAALGWVRLCAGPFIAAPPLNAVLGLEAGRDYLSLRVTPRGWYMAVAAFIGERPALGRPYLTGDIKAYYWPRDPLVDSQYRNPWLFRWARDAGPGRIPVRLRQRRIGCVIHRMEGSLTMQEIAGGFAWSDRSLAALERFVVRGLDPVWYVERPAENVYYQVWAVRPRLPLPRAAGLRWLHLPYAELVYDAPDKALVAGRLDEAARGYRNLATRYPSLALPRLRLAEVARLRHDAAGQDRWEREAVRLLGLPER